MIHMSQSTMLSHDQISYDAVIATCNRAEALSLSIPLLLSQSRAPSRLIIVDSSDDPAPIRAVIAATTEGWSGDVIFETAKRGSALQRNQGLIHVKSPIVLFPDDDSLLYSDAAEQILAVYERDVERKIAAVCAAESLDPPPTDALKAGYALSRTDVTRRRRRSLRARIEKRISAISPLRVLGARLSRAWPVPDWMADLDAVPVEYMTGFRMSFRTDEIRHVGFDETLGGYALCEDIDASLAVMDKGLVVAAKRAKIYHHKYPGSRSAGRTMGAIEVMNPLYVGLKQAQSFELPESEMVAFRRTLRLFLVMRLALRLTGVGSAFGRARLAGSWSAIKSSRALWSAPRQQISRAYASAIVRALAQ